MITKKMLLYFPECETESPIVYHLVKDYDLMINIFRARVTPDEEGFLVLDVTGSEEFVVAVWDGETSYEFVHVDGWNVKPAK